jgi:pimeloyl-ACP methyl ester carboxylesterase
MFPHVKEGTINVNNIKMDYIRFGKGKKNLIMIQGLNTKGIKGSGIMLSFMYNIFTKDYTVYLFDRRKDVYEGITIETFADDMAVAMKSLNIENADILGVSQGGMIGQYLAIKYPHLVNKLVLALTLSQNNDLVNSVINKWVKLTKENKFKELIYDMAINMYSDEYIKKYKIMMPLLTFVQKPKDISRFIILCKSCLTCNTFESLDKIKCPTFVIGARQDRIVGCDASIEIADQLNCPIHIYEDLGHAAYEEANDFNQLVYDFLNK